MKVLDTYAWIEYFAGTKKGKRVDGTIRSEETVATPVSCLTEIKRKRKRDKTPWESELKFIFAHSAILPLTKEIALRAGDIGELHFADALVYATALEHNATLLTGDPHFKGLRYVEML